MVLSLCRYEGWVVVRTLCVSERMKFCLIIVIYKTVCSINFFSDVVPKHEVTIKMNSQINYGFHFLKKENFFVHNVSKQYFKH